MFSLWHRSGFRLRVVEPLLVGLRGLSSLKYVYVGLQDARLQRRENCFNPSQKDIQTEAPHF